MRTDACKTLTSSIKWDGLPWISTCSSAGLYKVVSKSREVGVEGNTGDSFKKIDYDFF